MPRDAQPRPGQHVVGARVPAHADREELLRQPDPRLLVGRANPVRRVPRLQRRDYLVRVPVRGKDEDALPAKGRRAAEPFRGRRPDVVRARGRPRRRQLVHADGVRGPSRARPDGSTSLRTASASFSRRRPRPRPSSSRAPQTEGSTGARDRRSRRGGRAAALRSSRGAVSRQETMEMSWSRGTTPGSMVWGGEPSRSVRGDPETTGGLGTTLSRRS